MNSVKITLIVGVMLVAVIAMPSAPVNSLPNAPIVTANDTAKCNKCLKDSNSEICDPKKQDKASIIVTAMKKCMNECCDVFSSAFPLDKDEMDGRFPDMYGGQGMYPEQGNGMNNMGGQGGMENGDEDNGDDFDDGFNGDGMGQDGMGQDGMGQDGMNGMDEGDMDG
ncbi:Uncharacterised protein g8742 [Pycnogonum litorale]